MRSRIRQPYPFSSAPLLLLMLLSINSCGQRHGAIPKSTTPTGQRGEIGKQSRFTPSTLRGILNITTLNKYNSNLTARDVGVSQTSWADVKSKFDNPQSSMYAKGVTLEDGRVFLNDNTFYIAGPFAQMFYSSVDLSGTIVHEFFHRAGLSEAQVQALHEGIQKNCGIPGFAL